MTRPSERSEKQLRGWWLRLVLERFGFPATEQPQGIENMVELVGIELSTHLENRQVTESR